MLQNKNQKLIFFAVISPHPPIILPSVGSLADRQKVRKTITLLNSLGQKLKALNSRATIISSPHRDWGIEVPLYFLNPYKQNKLIEDYQGPEDLAFKETDNFIIYPVLTTLDSPYSHFDWGRETYLKIKQANLKTGLIASGDLSHCLKKDGPYGFNDQGPKFDRDLIAALKKKDIKQILKLNKLYPEAGQCGLSSICFMLGILEESGVNYQIEKFSYQAPFGVGYLTANFKIS